MNNEMINIQKNKKTFKVAFIFLERKEKDDEKFISFAEKAGYKTTYKLVSGEKRLNVNLGAEIANLPSNAELDVLIISHGPSLALQREKLPNAIKLRLEQTIEDLREGLNLNQKELFNNKIQNVSNARIQICFSGQEDCILDIKNIFVAIFSPNNDMKISAPVKYSHLDLNNGVAYDTNFKSLDDLKEKITKSNVKKEPLITILNRSNLQSGDHNRHTYRSIIKGKNINKDLMKFKKKFQKLTNPDMKRAILRSDNLDDFLQKNQEASFNGDMFKFFLDGEDRQFNFFDFCKSQIESERSFFLEESYGINKNAEMKELSSFSLEEKKDIDKNYELSQLWNEITSNSNIIEYNREEFLEKIRNNENEDKSDIYKNIFAKIKENHKKETISFEDFGKLFSR